MSITVMRQALKDIVKVPTLTHGVLVKLSDVEQAIAEAAVAEQHKKQEPVGYADRSSLNYLREGLMDKIALVDKESAHIDDETGDDVPLYTFPPQRPAAVGEDTPTAERSSRTTEWVGLTDEEILKCENSIPDNIHFGTTYCILLVKAAEAKLKAKNERLEKNKHEQQ